MERIGIGKSYDKVYRLIDDEGNASYQKIGGKQVIDEYQRLQWLQGKLPVAQIISFEESEGEHRLVTSAVPGIMAHECDASQREEVVRSIARALRRVQALPIADCPFDQTIERQLEQATENTSLGLVDESDFDPMHMGMKATELLPLLFAKKPLTFQNVFTHGDYCLPNILIDPITLEVNGFIDLGRCGVSDHYLDLAIAMNTLDHNFGPGYEEIFFDAYGITDVDQSRIAFYQMLDEFF